MRKLNNAEVAVIIVLLFASGLALLNLSYIEAGRQVTYESTTWYGWVGMWLCIIAILFKPLYGYFSDSE